MNPNWNRLEQLLIASSETAIRRFITSLKSRKLLAIGYVFELGNNSPQFDLCANVSGDRDFLHEFDDEDRWNSGDYEYPAGLLDSKNELGAEWDLENRQLHALANDPDRYAAIYAGIVDVACNSLIELAFRDVIPSPLAVDYNVSEVGDDLSVVASRHALILNAVQNRK
ncbi:MAG: hypothetical protein AB7O38_09340 [Pirellulaceae bacterium]